MIKRGTHILRQTAQDSGAAPIAGLTVIDGDDFSGERRQLGRNERWFGRKHSHPTSGTFALYQQGQPEITFISMRQGANFNPNVNAWQQIGQMKQAQPSPATGPIDGTPSNCRSTLVACGS